METRKEQKLRHANIIIPADKSETGGYYMDCYRKCIALSKKHHEIMNSKRSEDLHTDNVSSSNTRAIRSEITSLKVAKRTCRFSSVCLFSDQGRKRVQGVTQKLVNVETKDFEEKIRKYVEWIEDKWR